MTNLDRAVFWMMFKLIFRVLFLIARKMADDMDGLRLLDSVKRDFEEFVIDFEFKWRSDVGDQQ